MCFVEIFWVLWEPNDKKDINLKDSREDLSRKTFSSRRFLREPPSLPHLSLQPWIKNMFNSLPSLPSAVDFLAESLVIGLSRELSLCSLILGASELERPWHFERFHFRVISLFRIISHLQIGIFWAKLSSLFNFWEESLTCFYPEGVGGILIMKYHIIATSSTNIHSLF